MIKLHTLGRLSLTGPDGHEILSVLAQPKRGAVLTYMALATPRGFHRRDTLLGLFWPDLDQEHARGALSQALSFLRRSLGDVIETRGDDEVGLVAEGLWCDAVGFEASLDAGQPSGALELYQGDLLAGFFIGDAPEFEHWLDRERERLRRRATEAAWLLADESEAEGNAPDAKRWARRAATLAPDDESVLRRLIALLDRVGDRAQAVVAYETFARRLSEEYELNPSPETQELIDDIRARVESSPQFVTPEQPPQVKPGDASENDAAPTKAARRRSLVPSVGIAAAAVTVLSILAVVRVLTTPGYALDDTPPTSWPTALAISPGGERIVYVSEEQGPPRLWVRSLDSGGGRPLVGTDYATGPFWSPDGRFIGFFADGLIKTIDVDSGAIEALTTTLSGTGGSWNADGVILYTGTVNGVYSVPATGGPDGWGPDGWAVLRNRDGQTGLRAPHFLPDGRHFLYRALGMNGGLCISVLEEAEIEIRRLNPDRLDPEQLASYGALLQNMESTREVECLVDSGSAGVYHPSGHLLYVRGDTLYAYGFDLDEMSLTGEEFAVTDERISWTRGGGAALSVSNAGDVVYRARTDGVGAWQLTWVDRDGNELERLGAPQYFPPDPELSPDGDRVTFHRAGGGAGLDIYLIDSDGGEREPLASQPGLDYGPAWSPDGERIAFLSLSRGTDEAGLVWTAADGSGTPVRMLASSGVLNFPVVSDWSDDGRYLALRNLGEERGFDIFGADLDGEGTAFPIVQTPASEHGSQFSPDGRWIAYQSDETGRFEIYVQPFPGSGGRIGPISSQGGVQVRWREDGRELFYVAYDGWLMSVSVESPGLGEPISFGAPVPLFEAGLSAMVPSEGSQHEYAVTEYGQRFLISRIRREESPITVLPDWRPGS